MGSPRWNDSVHNYDPSHQRPTWVYPLRNPELLQSIVHEFKIHPVTAQILISRGFTSLDVIHTYLYGRLPDLHDPFLMEPMKAAVERICEAIDRKEQILIYGDNDVDGITGTALLTEFFRWINANVVFYLSKPGTPRSRLLIEGLEKSIEKNHQKPSLIITVDCGITSAHEVAQVVAQQVDVIITDHHEASEEIPRCTAILNPKLPGTGYPERGLTGVGVAFKLAHALTNTLIKLGRLEAQKVDLKQLLDLVALGTVADTGSLRSHENRIFVKYGLLQIQEGHRIGLLKLMHIANVDPLSVSPQVIVTRIAPRLNSLGRIDDPNKGVELLLAQDAEEAEKKALDLDLNNIARQKIERAISADVNQLLRGNPDIFNHNAIVMASKQWHPGVIPILSTRISRYHNRPTILIAIDKGIGKGSLRSIPEFPLLDVLKECSSLLINFGGHDFAAGLSIEEANIPIFREKFIRIADERLTEKDVVNKLFLDAELRFTDLTFDLLDSIQLFAPFGHENPQPIFYTTVQQARLPKVSGKDNLKLFLQQEERIFEGIALRRSSEVQYMKQQREISMEIAFVPQASSGENQASMQLFIRDFQLLTMHG